MSKSTLHNVHLAPRQGMNKTIPLLMQNRNGENLKNK